MTDFLLFIARVVAFVVIVVLAILVIDYFTGVFSNLRLSPDQSESQNQRAPDGDRRTMPIESGQSRCNKFYPGTTFMGWDDEARGIAHCRGDGEGRRGALEGPSAPVDYAEPPHDDYDARGSRKHYANADKSGQARCNEVHPGSTFVKWMNQARGEAHCRRPKSAGRG